MQQRLCLAHALVHDPQVLLLDEPASGLDPRARVELRELLRELRSLGKTILISSATSFPSSRSCAPSVAIIDRGQVLAHGRVADIERRLRVGAVLRVRVLGDDDGHRGRARRGSRDQHNVASAQRPRRRHDRDRASAATTRAPRALLAAAVGAGLRIATFARAASDLEELFLQVTARDEAGRRAGARAR